MMFTNFYIINRLNYRPTWPALANIGQLPANLNGQKATKFVVAIDRLCLSMIPSPTIANLVKIIVKQPPSSSHIVASISALASVPTLTCGQAAQLIGELVPLVDVEQLNDIDKRQLVRSAVVLSLEENFSPALILSLFKLGETFRVEDEPKSSRSHAIILKQLRSILPDHQIESEVLVDPISSYIDIVISVL